MLSIRPPIHAKTQPQRQHQNHYQQNPNPQNHHQQSQNPDQQSQNQILAALPVADHARLLPHLEKVTMPQGTVLFESGAHIHYLYFPISSIVTLLYCMENGTSSQVAMIGNEGVVGVPLILGTDSMPSCAVVQCAGEGYRLKASILQQELAMHGEFQNLLMVYAQALMTQTAQNAVCNRCHTLDQQLCKWLLSSLDRTAGNELVMTQELIANNLGVRREGVTEAACKLQAQGLIRYHRGHISVLDRAGLECHVCECYAAVNREYARLFCQVAPQSRTAVRRPSLAAAPAPALNQAGVLLSGAPVRALRQGNAG